MKFFLVPMVTVVLAAVLAGCSDSGDGFVQEPLPATTETVTPGAPVQPDPVITEPVNSRFVGTIKAAASGAGQNTKYDFDSVFEYREKNAGRLIGYTQMHDKLQDGKLIVDYWSEGKRTDANVVLYLSFNPACSNLKLAGKLDAQGGISFPKTTQKLGCGFLVSVTVVTEATVFTRPSATVWPFWKEIEAHYATQ